MVLTLLLVSIISISNKCNKILVKENNMSNKQKYIIAITKKEARFPQNWDDQNYFDEKDNFDVFFEGELTEEEMEKKFDEAIHYALDNFGRGGDFRPVFVFDGDGVFLSIEGSSNIKYLSLHK